MPCSPKKARILLKQEKAVVIRRKPFTIKLLYGGAGYKQPVTLGIDTGYSNVGLSAVTDKREVFSGVLKLRSNIVKLISDKRMYRRNRRGRLWYRPCRFLNRVKSKKKGGLAPSIKHKLNSHVRIVEFVNKLLPITKINIEVANFDIQKIKNPNIEGKEYQKGDQKNFYNIREYVLYRDNHRCQSCKGKTKDKRLEVHHLISRKIGGDRPDNLVTLCSVCHSKVSSGELKLNIKITKGFKAESFMSTIRWKILESIKDKFKNIDINITYGYITKLKRASLKLPKNHSNDAFVIADGKDQESIYTYNIVQNRRNNRKLQLNRKGFKPSIRKQKYPLQSRDLVKVNNKLCTVKGCFSYGKWVRLVDKLGNVINKNISKISLIRYGKGFMFNEK